MKMIATDATAIVLAQEVTLMIDMIAKIAIASQLLVTARVKIILLSYMAVQGLALMILNTQNMITATISKIMEHVEDNANFQLPLSLVQDNPFPSTKISSDSCENKHKDSKPTIVTIDHTTKLSPQSNAYPRK